MMSRLRSEPAVLLACVPLCLLSLALSVAVAAGSESAGSTNAAAVAAGPGPLAPGVRSKPRGDGWVFEDEGGMTLYTFDRDEGTPGKSSCNGPCAAAWPPLAAPADATAPAGWAAIAREDGSRQWTWRGRPLYRYAADAFPGATFGDGVETVWRVAFQPIALPREVRLGRTTLGNVLTDARGHTLYASSDDSPGATPRCESRCLRTWRPVAAPWLARPFDDWTPVVRADGTRQWAYKGQPLYLHAAGDFAPGEVSGNAIEGWRAIVLESAPQLPPWATIQASDAGELIANPKGLTVYSHGANSRGQRRNQSQAICPDGTCIDPQWVPFMAEPGAKPVGSWTILDLQDGRKQWAYKGAKLYTNSLDTRPGDFKGIRFGGDRSWSAIMRDGEPMQGVSVGG